MTQLATAFNLILSFDGAPQIGLPTSKALRNFLHECLALELSPSDLCVVVCALRGVGNEDSIAKIKKLPVFTYPYEGLEREVIAKIRRRLKR